MASALLHCSQVRSRTLVACSNGVSAVLELVQTIALESSPSSSPAISDTV